MLSLQVKDLCRKVSLSEQEKEKLRLTLMTKGLDAVALDTGAGKETIDNRHRVPGVVLHLLQVLFAWLPEGGAGRGGGGTGPGYPGTCAPDLDWSVYCTTTQ